LEEEVEKLRNDIDCLRLNKDDEIKNKDIKIIEIKDKLLKKQSEFDELQTLKLTLQQEIDLYRKILSEAEKEAGFNSPFVSSSSSNNHNNNNGNNIHSRKKRKLTSGEHACYPTPGIARAAQVAKQDLNKLNDYNDEHDNKEDEECNNNNNNDNNNNNNNNNGFSEDDDEDEDDNMYNNNESATPGEAFPLQFSTMDLGNSMIELQNISENNVSLKGFMITNKDQSAKFPLPEDKILQPNERVRVIIGLRCKCKQNEILWKSDVWGGDEEDVARLYDPDHKEIARIEIHPDMLPQQDSNRCLIM
jgi:hypothetical protein